MICVSVYVYSYTHICESVPSTALKTPHGMKHQNADYKNTVSPRGVFVK